jgi:probable HAF family extracellular repeat protein
MLGLGALPGGGFSSRASGVSADGSIIVGLSTTGEDGFGRAFIWDQVNGIRSLSEMLIAQGDDPTGWRLILVGGISG